MEGDEDGDEYLNEDDDAPVAPAEDNDFDDDVEDDGEDDIF